VTLSAAATWVVASGNDVYGDTSRDGWLSRQQVEAQLTQVGYRVHRLEADDGCLEAHVTAQDGVRAELYVDPATGMPGCREADGEFDD
jgi:hypothetical protein